MLDILDPLLRPLARLLVARGVIFPDLADRMKHHYVEAAKGKLAAEGAKQTDSRLSTMTGLQRREVARLKDGLPPPAPSTNYLVRLVSEWQTNPIFAGRVLPKSGDPSFESLARQVHQDVHPRTMLDELLASDTVAYYPDTDQVRLIATSYLPLAGSEDQIDYLARNTGDHLAAATENVVGEAGHFERATHYSNLTADQINALTEMFEDEQMKLLERISQTAADMKRDKTGQHRMRVGAYFYKTKGPSQ